MGQKRVLTVLVGVFLTNLTIRVNKRGAISMNEKFFNLPLQKQYRILNAAMKEFVVKGYQSASTNEIVKEAQISKGLLFHYFENKKQLFLYLCEYCVDLALEQFYKKSIFTEGDLFLRIKEMTLLKIGLMDQHPDLFNFLTMAFNENHEDVSTELKEKLVKASESGYQQLFRHIDYSKFKDELDMQMMINMMMWTYQGFSEVELMNLKECEDVQETYYRIFKDIDKYTNMMRLMFYK
ncbi:MAG TPA: TetR family transcriptional regulator [Firmicutes bacterium]|nr:TetR family transcriptional regulator [Bacillota bacterium]